MGMTLLRAGFILTVALKRYLVGRVPGSKMSIPFKATLGDVKVYYQRSAKYGLGQADCWVDDDGKSNDVRWVKTRRGD